MRETLIVKYAGQKCNAIDNVFVSFKSCEHNPPLSMLDKLKLLSVDKLISNVARAENAELFQILLNQLGNVDGAQILNILSSLVNKTALK
jgi:hypothetical protein